MRERVENDSPVKDIESNEEIKFSYDEIEAFLPTEIELNSTGCGGPKPTTITSVRG